MLIRKERVVSSDIQRKWEGSPRNESFRVPFWVDGGFEYQGVGGHQSDGRKRRGKWWSAKGKRAEGGKTRQTS